MVIIGGEASPYGVDFFSRKFDNIADVSKGRTYNMDNDDIEFLLNDIRTMFNGLLYQHVDKKSKFKRMAMAETTDTTGDGLPRINISPANMSIIDEEQPLIIECNVDTSDAATVLIKHNGEIIHEQHIL